MSTIANNNFTSSASAYRRYDAPLREE